MYESIESKENIMIFNSKFGKEKEKKAIVVWNKKYNLSLTKFESGEISCLALYFNILYDVVRTNKDKKKVFKDVKHICSEFFKIYFQPLLLQKEIDWG